MTLPPSLPPFRGAPTRLASPARGRTLASAPCLALERAPSPPPPPPRSTAADDDAWHERLVAYYSRFGFVPVRRVEGGSLGDLPHMLVWGGVGTRMDADVARMLRRWTPAIRGRRRGGAGSGSSGGEEEGGADDACLQ